MRKRKKLTWDARQRIKQGFLIGLIVILGLGALTYTGKLLNDKYDWVEKARDLFVKPGEDEGDINDSDIAIPAFTIDFSALDPDAFSKNEQFFEIDIEGIYTFGYKSSTKLDNFFGMPYAGSSNYKLILNAGVEGTYLYYMLE